MLKFTGDGNTLNADITIYGDGTSTSIELDLSKAPFNIAFLGGIFPSVVFDTSGVSSGRTLSINRDKLTVVFATAPAASDFTPPGTGQPNVSFTIQFVYG